VTIETKTGMKIAMTATSLQITDGAGGEIKLEGPKVTINNGALEVLF
jgi:hypothetical protein